MQGRFGDTRKHIQDRVIGKDLCFIPTLFLIFRERGKKEERERNTDVREKHHSVASCTCPD